MHKESTKRPAPSSPAELYQRTVEGNHDPFMPNVVASFRARLRNLVDAGRVANPGQFIAAALDCQEIPSRFRHELRDQVNEARASARYDRPDDAPQAAPLSDAAVAMNAEVFPSFLQFLNALGGTPEAIDAARDRFQVELRASAARHGVAIPWADFAPARAAFGIEPRALPWERVHTRMPVGERSPAGEGSRGEAAVRAA